MPNSVGIRSFAAASGGTQITATDVPIVATQATVSVEVGPLRLNLRAVSSTGVSGGTLLFPGDVVRYFGNNYHDAFTLLTGSSTSATNGTIVIEFFDGYDRA